MNSYVDRDLDGLKSVILYFDPNNFTCNDIVHPKVQRILTSVIEDRRKI